MDKAVAQVEATYKQKMTEAALQASKQTIELRQSADALKDTKDAQIKTLRSKLDIALSELRNRPYRPSDYTPPSQGGTACSGTELFREDAEFLTREAARADKIIVERDYYYKQYEDARLKLEEYGNRQK